MVTFGEPSSRERAMDVLCRSPSAWSTLAAVSPNSHTVNRHVSTVGLGFVFKVVSSGASGVWWAHIICICTIDYISLRPIEKTSVHVRLHLEECTTSKVRV